MTYSLRMRLNSGATFSKMRSVYSRLRDSSTLAMASMATRPTSTTSGSPPWAITLSTASSGLAWAWAGSVTNGTWAGPMTMGRIMASGPREMGSAAQRAVDGSRVNTSTAAGQRCLARVRVR